MRAQDLMTGEWKFFVDKCLPFGSSISCALFQKFSDALCHLIEHKTNSRDQITNYLDDFLFLAFLLAHCNSKIEMFINLCNDLGVPISIDKTEFVQESIVFLGILLDGKHLILAVPCEKRDC